MQVAESSQRGYLVSSNEIYLAPYDSAKALVDTQLARLKSALQPFPATARLLDRLTRLVADKIADMDQTIAAKREFRESDALAAFGSNRGKALMDEANVFLSSIIRTTDERLTRG